MPTRSNDSVTRFGSDDNADPVTTKLIKRSRTSYGAPDAKPNEVAQDEAAQHVGRDVGYGAHPPTKRSGLGKRV